MIMKVARKDVRAIIDATYPEYKGRKIHLIPTNSVVFNGLNWCEGSRNTYRTCTIDGDQLNGAGRFNACPPWANALEGKTLPLPPGHVCVEHTIFCGKDLGLRIYVNITDMPKWFPEISTKIGENNNG
jgi:hypothetical protein